MRLIDADALKEKTTAHGEKIAYTVSFLWDIDDSPTIDAVPVRHGEWVWKHRHHGGFKTAKGKCECGRDVYAQIDERYESDDPYCPFCGVMNDSIYLSYCPNCGARMDGERREATPCP